MAGLGYLMQGIAQGMAQGREFKRATQEDQSRQDFLKSQKKLLDLTLKTKEAEQTYIDALSPEDKQNYYLYGGKDPLTIRMAKILENMDKGRSTKPVDLTGAMSTEQGPFIPSQGGLMPQGQVDETGMPVEQAGAGLPDMMAGIGMKDIQRGIIKKMLGGYDPFEKTQRTLAGGKTGKATFNITPWGEKGEMVGEEPVEMQSHPTTIWTKEGSELVPSKSGLRFYNPHEPMKDITLKTEKGDEAKNIIETGPAPTEPRERKEKGVTFKEEFYKGTNIPVPGTKRVTEGMPQQTAYYKANIEKVATPSARNLINNLFTKEGGETKLTLNAKLQGTFPDISHKLGGEIAEDAMKIAYALLRPETGAMINDQELRVKINQLLPKAFTTAKYAMDNILQIGDVIDSYLKSIDPDYQPQAKQIIQEQLNKFTGKKPSLNLGKTGVPGSPKIGEVQKGYKFKGGDPSLEESWEKVK